MTHGIHTTPLNRAALIAGVAILVMAIAAPYAELFVYPQLVVRGNAAQTAANIIANEKLFVSGIFGYLITFVCDLVAAWALYVLLRPVNDHLSLLAGWFRLAYGVIAFVALLQLVTVWQLLTTPDYLAVFERAQLYAQVRLALGAFKNGWYLAILLFAIHLGLLGFLVLRSNYIPRILGVLLIICGMGYLITTLGPFWFPNVKLDVARFTFVGELIFMVWLIVRGSRIGEYLSDGSHPDPQIEALARP